MPDNAFITNSKSRTLKKRLEELIHYSRELKFLVGFFYFSGWRELYDSLKNRRDLIIKLLVGLDVDKALNGVLEVAKEGETTAPRGCFANGGLSHGDTLPLRGPSRKNTGTMSAGTMCFANAASASGCGGMTVAQIIWPGEGMTDGNKEKPWAPSG